MELRYEYTPLLKAEQVAELRKSVGWDGRVEKYRKKLGKSYFCVTCLDGERLVGPVELRSRGLAARIVASAGPWRTSGEWWTARPWVRDEWDVELGVAPGVPGQQALICRLAHDGSAWWLDGVYD